jgi:hypothetical protein
MTLGELKIACLKLINNTNEALTVERLGELESDDNYNTVLLNCFESINRAISRLLAEKKIPYDTFYITPTTVKALENTNLSRYDVSSLATDVNTIIRVYCEDDKGNGFTINSLRTEGKNIVLPNITKGLYIVTYLPNVLLKSTDTNATVLKIPDYICNLIPHYVKGELQEEDEPSLALASKNYFELAIGQIKVNEDSNRQDRVQTIFRLY